MLPKGQVIWGWDTPNKAGVKILVDSLGHLQVDVLSGVGVASQCYGWIGDVWYHLLVESAAHPNLRTKLYDGTNPIVSVGTAASIADTNRGLFTQAGIRGRDDSFWRAINAEDNPLDALSNDRVSLSGISKLYGFNGVTWSRLRVESDALFNLRVKLFDGANGIDSDTIPAYPTISGRGILTLTQLFAKSGVNVYAIDSGNLAADNIATSGIGLNVRSFLHGFDGTYWDRLRTWGVGVLKVGRAGFLTTITRMTGTGQVGAVGAHFLYWVACSPESANAEWELSDATTPGQAVVYDHFDNDKHSEHITFDPPMPFSAGIYVEKFDHQKSLVFCYI